MNVFIFWSGGRFPKEPYGTHGQKHTTTPPWVVKMGLVLKMDRRWDRVQIEKTWGTGERRGDLEEKNRDWKKIKMKRAGWGIFRGELWGFWELEKKKWELAGGDVLKDVCGGMASNFPWVLRSISGSNDLGSLLLLLYFVFNFSNVSLIPRPFDLFVVWCWSVEWNKFFFGFFFILLLLCCWVDDATNFKLWMVSKL